MERGFFEQPASAEERSAEEISATKNIMAVFFIRLVITALASRQSKAEPSEASAMAAIRQTANAVFAFAIESPFFICFLYCFKRAELLLQFVGKHRKNFFCRVRDVGCHDAMKGDGGQAKKSRQKDRKAPPMLYVQKPGIFRRGKIVNHFDRVFQVAAPLFPKAVSLAVHSLVSHAQRVELVFVTVAFKASQKKEFLSCDFMPCDCSLSLPCRRVVSQNFQPVFL